MPRKAKKPECTCPCETTGPYECCWQNDGNCDPDNCVMSGTYRLPAQAMRNYADVQATMARLRGRTGALSVEDQEFFAVVDWLVENLGPIFLASVAVRALFPQPEPEPIRRGRGRPRKAS